ncbi:unnamed protein product, partial [Phaeothamnion confervicola]
ANVCRQAEVLEESLLDATREAELHKSKRLAARAEMVGMARLLEAERDGHRAVETHLQYTLVPKAIEQVLG